MLQIENNINIMLFAMIFIAIIVIISVVVLFGLFMSKKNNLIKENLEAALENQKHLHELELKAL